VVIGDARGGSIGDVSDELPTPRQLRQARVAEVARRQWGCITSTQLADAGVSTSTMHRWLREGRLHRLHRGVYAVGHRASAPEARWAAALLACGEGAALSHQTAAALHGLIEAQGIVRVSLTRQVRAPRGVEVHCPSMPFQRGELVRAKGLVATSVPRTLLDLAACGVRVERLVADAVARRLVTMEVLRAFVASRPGARGCARLRCCIEGRHTRSGAERRFVAWLEERGIAVPAMNVRVGKLTVDGLWEDAGLVLEVDTVATHGTAFSFENDRLRDAYLAARGLRTIRVTEHRWTTDGDRLARDIRRALSTKFPTGGRFVD
jgi:very-short-patch-repair endonuclease